MNEIQLAALADKLGVASEIVWEATIRQAGIEFWWNGAFISAMWLATAVTLVLFIYRESKNPDSKKELSETGGCLFFIAAVLFICSIILTPIAVIDMVTLANNPEFWAIEELTKIVKSR